MDNKFYLLPWRNNHKKNKKGLHPVWIRITYRGERAEVSTGIYIKNDDWKGGENPIKGSRDEVTAKNKTISNMKVDIHTTFNELVSEGKDFSADDIKNRYLGKDSINKGIIEIFDFHNRRLSEMAEAGKTASSTVEIYSITRDQLMAFISTEFNKGDLNVKDVDYAFVADFHYHLQSKLKNTNNTVRKKLQRLGKILNLAFKNGWIQRNPVQNYELKEDVKEVIYLDQEELDSVLNLDISTERLRIVKDLFIFCCYTGLAYNELAALMPSQIGIGIDGGKIMNIFRQKTKKHIKIPLLDPALRIIEEYKNHPESNNKGRVFPVRSNQKLNEYLKEIATLAGINKEITTHTARKTFATTIALLNGVPMETVSEILGHSSIRITQKAYGKIVDQKVSQDMNELNRKLKVKNKKEIKKKQGKGGI